MEGIVKNSRHLFQQRFLLTGASSITRVWRSILVAGCLGINIFNLLQTILVSDRVQVKFLSKEVFLCHGFLHSRLHGTSWPRR